ncbi:MAG: transaldolase [Chloroflexi bacterium]|nr:transaldolase [Chloroflexota bacterium]
MASNPLREIAACGQSLWLDSISRQLLNSGTLKRLVDDDGISGVTANPTIFEKAIAHTHDYDDSIREAGSRDSSPIRVYEHLAVEDVGAAADLLRPVYDRTGGKDGFVSIEVSPDIAFDTRASIEEGCRFWMHLHRPNVLIKIPATPAGLPAIQALIADGVNVNITLIFAVEVHEQVMEAYISGLEQRAARGESIEHIASVASFFVSRVDTLVDQLLDEKAREADEATRQEIEGLKGKAAVANAKIAYEHFQRVFSTDRFKKLEARGAQLQRPLWASTSTKNPSYSDTMYVTPLIGPHTVNTMPMETIDAVRDHGEAQCGSITQGLDEAHRVMQDLERVGISMKAVTDQLTEEGVEKFAKSLHSLLDSIGEQQRSLVGA